MNNNDLRGVIFSYFRGPQYIKCDECNGSRFKEEVIEGEDLKNLLAESKLPA